MIKSQRELNRAIYSTKQNLKNEDIFLSEAYNHFLSEQGHSVVRATVKGESKMINTGDALAFTDGNDCYINYGSPVAASLTTREDKHNYFTGLNLHEYGHKLFTDFKFKKECESKLRNRDFFPMPKDNPYLADLLDYLADETSDVASLVGLYHCIDNTVEDGFVDRAVCIETPGYAECLKYSNLIDAVTDIEPLSEMRKREGIDNVTILGAMVLNYCVHNYKGYTEAEFDPSDEIMASFEEIIPVLHKAVYEARPKERQRLINEVFCYLFHFIKRDDEEKQKQENQGQKQNQGQSQGGNGQGGGQGNQGTGGSSPTSSSSSLNQAVRNAASNVKNSEKNEHKNPTSSNSEAIKEIAEALGQAGEKVEGEKETSAKNENSGVEKTLDQISTEVAISQVSAEQEKEIKNSMANNVKKFLDGVQIHEHIGCQTIRTPYTNTAKSDYDRYHAELDTIVRRFIKEFEKEIKDRQLGDTMLGLYQGKSLDSKHLYRNDKRIFSNKKLPEDIPDMAVGILIDCSGSMSGGRNDETSRIMVAKKCAYITYTFCQRLHIPCFVIGHTTRGADVILHSVADENCLDSKDAIRIFDLEATGSNRDGFALRYCLGKLDQMVAKDKLMMIISDGRPAHRGYGMESGQKDCQDAVHTYIKRGITTIAAGLDMDAHSVKEVYKEGRSDRDSAVYLDISDMSRMPKAFVKIIKTRLERTA